MTLYFDNNLPDVPGLIEEIVFSPNNPLVACRSYSGSTGQGVISIFNTGGLESVAVFRRYLAF